MPELRKLREELSQEENDLKAMGIGRKIIREERAERFEKRWLPKFKKAIGESIFYDQGKDCWTITADLQETIDYYPKANKLLIRQKNQWIQPALRYLVQKFLTH